MFVCVCVWETKWKRNRDTSPLFVTLNFFSTFFFNFYFWNIWCRMKMKSVNRKQKMILQLQFFCYNSRLFSFINLLSLLTFFAFINFINNFLQLICFSSTFSILIQFYEYLFEFKISTFILTDETDSLLQKWCKWKINICFHWTILKYFFLQKCWRKRHWQYNEKKKRKRI